MPFIQPCLYNIYIYTHISQSVVLEGDNIPNYADFLCLPIRIKGWHLLFLRFGCWNYTQCIE